MSVLNSKTELLILVIVRWHDYHSRQFLRNTIGAQSRFKSYPNLQLLFVFGIPNSATSTDLKSIQEENRINKEVHLIVSDYPSKHEFFRRRLLQII